MTTPRSMRWSVLPALALLAACGDKEAEDTSEPGVYLMTDMDRDGYPIGVDCDDAEVLLVAYGISARAARSAVRKAREKGIKAGLFRPITLWPFPESAFRKAAAKASSVLVPEMNAGQLCLEIERLRPDGAKVISMPRIDGEPIAPVDIEDKIASLVKKGKK